MACSSCGKPKSGNVVIKSTYVPKAGKDTKMTDVLMSFTVETIKNITFYQRVYIIKNISHAVVIG